MIVITDFHYKKIPTYLLDMVPKTIHQYIQHHVYHRGKLILINKIHKICVYQQQQTPDLWKQVVKVIPRLVMWLDYIHHTQPLTVYLLLTPFKKRVTIPSTTPYSIDNVNSAFTNRQEIIIFRHEEWFKVLLHEIIHFHVDFSSTQIRTLNQQATQLFNINYRYTGNQTMFDVSEAWVEAIAQCWYFILMSNSENWIQDFKRQQKFAQQQMNKYLRVQYWFNTGFKKSSSQKTANKRSSKIVVTENTNALAYYVITAIILMDVPWKYILNFYRHQIPINKLVEIIHKNTAPNTTTITMNTTSSTSTNRMTISLSLFDE